MFPGGPSIMHALRHLRYMDTQYNIMPVLTCVALDPLGTGNEEFSA